MYCQYFNMSINPFSSKGFYYNARLSAAVTYLQHQITLGGCILIDGKPGTGKSALAAQLVSQSGRKPLALTAAVDGQAGGIGRWLLTALGIDDNPALNPAQRVLKVMEHFNAIASRGTQWLVTIDQAEALSVESYHFLSALQSGLSSPHVTFLLIGQARKMAAIAPRALLRRLIHTRYRLQPMSAAESRAFIVEQLAAAGVEQPLFSEPVLRMAHQAAGGKPALLKAIAHAALTVAYAERSETVTRRQMGIALHALGLSAGSRRGLAMWLLLSALIAGTLGWTYYSPLQPWLPLPSWLTPPPPEVPAPAPRIEDQQSGPQEGMSQLFHVWGYRVEPAEAYCEQAERAQLICQKSQETLDAMVANGMPWMGSLKVNDRLIYVTVVKVTGSDVDVLIHDQTWTLKRDWFSQVWQGDAVQLWPLTPEGKSQVGRTSSAQDIAWLDKALSDILQLPPARRPVWGSALINRIKQFQQRENLKADGVVGLGTLLAIAKAQGTQPSLVTEDKGE